MSTLKDQITELARELAMRRKVWPRIPQTEADFVSRDHTTQYQTMRDVLELLKAMYAAEHQLITNRVARLKEEAAKQTQMEL